MWEVTFTPTRSNISNIRGIPSLNPGTDSRRPDRAVHLLQTASRRRSPSALHSAKKHLNSSFQIPFKSVQITPPSLAAERRQNVAPGRGAPGLEIGHFFGFVSNGVRMTSP